MSAYDYGSDLFTEPEGSPDTLANLGPLGRMAGVWEGTKGLDKHPVADDGLEADHYVEHYKLHAIDRQTNGPQIFYGLRYHTHITKPGEVETFHDQIGYWLWEPDAEMVHMTLAIPRAQVLLASGRAKSDSTEFEITAELGSETQGIVSNPFLALSFRTLSFKMLVRANPDGTWSYEQETVMQIADRKDRFTHTDHNTLSRVGPPDLNPLALAGEQ